MSGTRRRHRPGGFTLIELLVVIGIMLLLAGIISSVVFALRRRIRMQAASCDIKSFTMGLAAYRHDLGSYPPADITLVGGTAEYGLNEALVYYLGRRIIKGANLYGPYVNFKASRLRDDDGDGFKEYLDPFGTHYLYALNPSGTTTSSAPASTASSAAPSTPPTATSRTRTIPMARTI